MKRTSLAFLVVLGLVLALTPMVSVYAVELPAYIKFKGYALGTCFVMYGDPTIFFETPPVWYGNASGSMALGGYAKATSYQEITGVGAGVYNIYGWAYVTGPEGYVKAMGFLSMRWFENNKPHQLWIAIYSKPTSQGVFQPETDNFVAGLMGLPGYEPWLSYKGIYEIGSNVQYLTGSIAVWATKGVDPPWTGIEYIPVILQFGDHIMLIAWSREKVSISLPTFSATVPAATILVRNVKLL